MIKTTIGVEGMMCRNCENHVNEAIQQDFDIKRVTSSHEENKTEIISDGELSEEKLKNTIGLVGYKMTSYETAPFEKKGFSAFKK